ncbi:MAG: hypothetical protein Q8P18_09795 [Pseudomonadota bacterium]|nr:hypothetical protein [Pseudomonadota bacterium]
MNAKSADDIRGLEFDWLASDADGNVALFSTAGGGYVPGEFLRDTDAHDRAVDSISGMRARTRALFAPRLAPGLPNTWLTMAERGVFAFDSDSFGGPYRLVAAPEAPVRASELPEAAAAVVGGLILEHLRFAELKEITAGDLTRRPPGAPEGALVELYADFNNIAADGSLPLHCVGSVASIASLGQELREGKEVWLTDGELWARARLSRAGDGAWYARPGFPITSSKSGGR